MEDGEVVRACIDGTFFNVPEWPICFDDEDGSAAALCPTSDINDEIARGKGVWREFKSYLLADANEKVRACLRSPTNLDCEGGASPRRSPREQLLFFAPTGSIPLANRSSPICFLQELGDIKSDVSGNFVL
jgi:hypothetical protein